MLVITSAPSSITETFYSRVVADIHYEVFFVFTFVLQYNYTQCTYVLDIKFIILLTTLMNSTQNFICQTVFYDKLLLTWRCIYYVIEIVLKAPLKSNQPDNQPTWWDGAK